MLTLTYSSMKMLRSCPRQFELSVVMGIKTPPSEAMVEGSKIHSAIEFFIKRGEYPREDDPNKAAIIRGTVRAFAARFPELLEGISERQVEREFTDNIKIAGKIDIIKGNELYDIKVTSDPTRVNYLSSRQLDIYAWILEMEQPWINYILVPRLKIRKRKTEDYKDLEQRAYNLVKMGILVQRNPLTQLRLYRTERYIIESVTLLEFYLKNGFPRNYDFCENTWGVCPYAPMCELEDPTILIDGENFIQQQAHPELRDADFNIEKSTAIKLVQSGALKSLDRYGRICALVKAIVQDALHRNLEISDLRNCGIAITKNIQAAYEAIKTTSLEELLANAKEVKKDPAKDLAYKVIEEYNELANQFGLTPYPKNARSVKAVAASGLTNFSSNVMIWTRVKDEILNSEFLQGKRCDFKVSLYWLIKNRNWKRVLTGKYRDGRSPAANKQNNGKKGSFRPRAGKFRKNKSSKGNRS